MGLGRRRSPGVFLLIQTHVAQAKGENSDFGAANLPFEEIEVAQRCDGVVKRKRKAEGSGNAIRMGGRARAGTEQDASLAAPCCVRSEDHDSTQNIPLRSRL